jgi:hypothetical protein
MQSFCLTSYHTGPPCAITKYVHMATRCTLEELLSADAKSWRAESILASTTLGPVDVRQMENERAEL